MKKQQLYNLIKQRLHKILKEQNRLVTRSRQTDPPGDLSQTSIDPTDIGILQDPDINPVFVDPTPTVPTPTGYSTSCMANKPDYGDLVYYDSNCDSGNINSHYICCEAGNNSNDPETNISSDVVIPTNVGNLPVPASTICYCPNPTITNPLYCTDATCTNHTMQITPHQDPNWTSGTTTVLESCDITSHPDGTSGPSNNMVDFQAWLSVAGLSLPSNLVDVQSGDNCVGCVQTAANSATFQIDFNGNQNPNVLGCNGNHTAGGISFAGAAIVPEPNDLTCCAFDGCTATNTTPGATNLSSFNLNDGTSITMNENDTWSGGAVDFVDDGSCLFPGCTGITLVDAAGIDHVAPADQVTGLGTNSTQAGYTDVTLDDDSCEVQGCTDSSITGQVDSLNNTLVNNYLGQAGVNQSGTGQNYTIVDDGSCTIYACTDQNAANFFDGTNFPNVTFINETSPTDNTSLCQYTGCMDQTVGENVDVNGNDQNGNAATEPVPNNGGFLAINYDPQATLQWNGGTDPNYPNGDPCEYNIPVVTGCPDPAALNYYCDVLTATDPPCTGTNSDILPVNTDGSQLVYDTTPSMCDMPDYGCTTNGFNGDGSNSSTAYDAAHDIEETSATDDTNPCVYTGCVTEPTSGTYICNTSPGYLLCVDSGGAQLTQPDASGTVNTSSTWNGVTTATFTHNADACTFQGCTDIDDCGNYQQGYNLDCNGDNITDVNYIQAAGWNSCCDYSCRGCPHKQDNATPTNYNAQYTQDDGSCEFYYCTNPAAGGSSNVTPSNYVCTIATNDTYELCEDANGNQLTGVGTLNDVIRDGIANSNGSGVDMGTFYNTGCEYQERGCTNPLADNYDPNAIAGGDCVFTGCGDPIAENYAPADPEGNTWDFFDVTPITQGGLCEMEGCSQSSHPSDPNNTVAVAGTMGNNDGYHQDNNGCFATNSPVSGNGISPTGNLDPNNIDCCVFEGCTDPNANNYSQYATVDDGSCDMDCKNITAEQCRPAPHEGARKTEYQRSFSCALIGGQTPDIDDEFQATGYKLTYASSNQFTNVTPVINTSHDPSYPPFGTYANDGDYRQDMLTGLWYYWSSNASSWIFDSNYNVQQGNSENPDGTWTGTVAGVPELTQVPNAVYRVISMLDTTGTPTNYPKARCNPRGIDPRGPIGPKEPTGPTLGENSLKSDLLKSKKLREAIKNQIFNKK